MRFGRGTVAQGSRGVREPQREGVRRDVAAPRKERQAGKVLDRKGRRRLAHPARSDQREAWEGGKGKPLGRGKRSNKRQREGNKGPVRQVTREQPRGGCVTRRGDRQRHEAPLTCWQAPGRERPGQETRPPDLPQHAPPPPTHRPASPQAIRPRLRLLPIPNSCALEVEAKPPEPRPQLEQTPAVQTQQTSQGFCGGGHGKSSSVKHEQVGSAERQEESSTNKEKRKAGKRYIHRRKTKRKDRKDEKLCRCTPHLVKGGGGGGGKKAESLGEEVEVTVCKEKDNENGNLPHPPLPPPPLQGTRPTQSVKPLKGIRKQPGGEGGGGGGQKKRVRL